MTRIPSAVRRAAASRPRHDTLPPIPIERGDIRVVTTEGESRLVLVLSVDSENEFADVLLVHSAPELATDSDGVLNSADLNLPFPLVVQTDLRAVVWTLQIGEAVGRLSDDVFTQLNNIVRGAGPAVESGVTTGFTLSGPADRRWVFKKEEGHALRRLARMHLRPARPRPDLGGRRSPPQSRATDTRG